jgi:hypothetical protein
MVGCLAWTLHSEREVRQIPKVTRYSSRSLIRSFIRLYATATAIQKCVTTSFLQPRTINSVNDDLPLQLLKVLEEAVEEIHGMLNIMRATSLADAVHT